MKKIIGIIIALILIGFIVRLQMNQHEYDTTPRIANVNGIITISNCDNPRDDNAEIACPHLYCEKAVYETGLINGKYRLVSVEDRYNGDTKVAVITGKVEYKNTTTSNTLTRYMCIIKDNIIINTEVMSESDFTSRRISGELWKI